MEAGIPNAAGRRVQGDIAPSEIDALAATLSAINRETQAAAADQLAQVGEAAALSRPLAIDMPAPPPPPPAEADFDELEPPAEPAPLPPAVDAAEIDGLAAALQAIGDQEAAPAIEPRVVEPQVVYSPMLVAASPVEASSIPWAKRAAQWVAHLFNRETVVDRLDAAVENATKMLNLMNYRLGVMFGVDSSVRNSSSWFADRPFDAEMAPENVAILRNTLAIVEEALDDLAKAELHVSLKGIRSRHLARLKANLLDQRRVVINLIDIATAREHQPENLWGKLDRMLKAAKPHEYGRVVAQLYDREFNRTYSLYLGGNLDAQQLIDLQALHHPAHLYKHLRMIGHSERDAKKYTDRIVNFLIHNKAFRKQKDQLRKDFAQLFEYSVARESDVALYRTLRETVSKTDPYYNLRQGELVRRIGALADFDLSEAARERMTAYRLDYTLTDRIAERLEAHQAVGHLKPRQAAVMITEFMKTEIAILKKITERGDLTPAQRKQLRFRLFELEELSVRENLTKLMEGIAGRSKARAFKEEINRLEMVGERMMVSAEIRTLLIQEASGQLGEECVATIFQTFSDREARTDHLMRLFSTHPLSTESTEIQRHELAREYRGEEPIGFFASKWVPLYSLWKKGELTAEDLRNFRNTLFGNGELGGQVNRDFYLEEYRAFSLIFDPMIRSLLKNRGAAHLAAYDLRVSDETPLRERYQEAHLILGTEEEALEGLVRLYPQAAISTAAATARGKAKWYQNDDDVAAKAAEEAWLDLAMRAAPHTALFDAHFREVRPSTLVGAAVKSAEKKRQMDERVAASARWREAVRRADLVPRSELGAHLMKSLKRTPRKLLAAHLARATVDFTSQLLADFMAKDRDTTDLRNALRLIDFSVVEAACRSHGLSAGETFEVLDVVKGPIREVQLIMHSTADLSEVEVDPAAEVGSKASPQRLQRIMGEVKLTEESFINQFEPLWNLIHSQAYKRERAQICERAGIHRHQLDRAENAIREVYTKMQIFNQAVQAIEIPDDLTDLEAVGRAAEAIATLLTSRAAFEYQQGLINYSAQVDLLNEVMGKLEGDLQDEWLGNPEDQLTVGARVIAPLQRLPRWKLLLEDLMQALHSEDESIKRAVVKAVQGARAAAEEANELRRASDIFRGLA